MTQAGTGTAGAGSNGLPSHLATTIGAAANFAALGFGISMMEAIRNYGSVLGRLPAWQWGLIFAVGMTLVSLSGVVFSLRSMEIYLEARLSLGPVNAFSIFPRRPAIVLILVYSLFFVVPLASIGDLPGELVVGAGSLLGWLVIVLFLLWRAPEVMVTPRA